MNFDVFQSIEFPERGLLLAHCRAAERNANVDPYNSIASARTALELLCKTLLRINGLKVEPDVNGSYGLSAMVDTCRSHGLFAASTEAHMIRKDGNAALHIIRGKNVLYTDLQESLHTVNEANVSLAVNVVRNLYHVMQQAFRISEPDFDLRKIPFGDYEIIRAIPKAEREIIVGDYNYLVRNSSGECFYLQIFPKNSTDSTASALSGRSRNAAAIVREDREPKAFLRNTLTLFAYSEGADREFIAYPAYSNSFLLSEMITPMTPAQALHICLNLIDTLLEMQQLEQGLHHRNIQPACVLLSPSRGRFNASLVNFQTAKIENYNETILPDLINFYLSNLFTHPALRSIDPGSRKIDWEKADVYSVTRILVYCVKPKLFLKDFDVRELYKDYIFSEELVDSLCELFESSLPMICTLSELKEMLKDEAMQPQYR